MRVPTRRNRNIGTSRQGHGSNNRLTIPEPWQSPLRFFERLRHAVAVSLTREDRTYRFLIEPPEKGCFHPCTPEDIVSLLEPCPPAARQSFELIVLRQPKAKEKRLSPVWGRAIFHYLHEDFEGPAIILEAQDLRPNHWTSSLDPESAKELMRLEGDGHQITRQRSRVRIQATPESLRQTLLFRTLLHEMGHHVDFRQRGEVWGQIPRQEKEAFAHRFAEQMRSVLAETEAQLRLQTELEPGTLAQGARSAWFRPPVPETTSS